MLFIVLYFKITEVEILQFSSDLKISPLFVSLVAFLAARLDSP